MRRGRRDAGPSAPGRSLTIEAATPLASGIVTRTGGAALWSVMDRRNDLPFPVTPCRLKRRG
jgi:hypothetical protein